MNPNLNPTPTMNASTPPPTPTLNEDAACFAAALEAFACLSPAEQLALIADVRAMRGSAAAIHRVRLVLADSIDGAFDEDIADALRATSPTH